MAPKVTISNSVHRAHALAKNSIYLPGWGLLSVAKGKGCDDVMVVFTASPVLLSPVGNNVA